MTYFLTQQWLAESPWPLTAGFILFFCTPLGVVYLLSEKENNGLPVCLAHSGQIGELMLCVGIFVGISILGRHQPLPAWVTSMTFHTAVASVGIIVAILLLSSGKAGMAIHWDDRYHSAVIVPVLLYLSFAIALPAIWFNGTASERMAVAVVIALYLGFVIQDVATGRMDQRKYAAEQLGISLPLPLRK